MKKIIFSWLLCFFFLHAERRGIFPISSLERREQGTTIINNPTIPLIISSPGDYRLISNIALDAVTSTTLIKITSNNVKLNLYGRALSQNMPSTKNMTGIYIADDVSNVTIENGNINGLTGTGVIVGQNCFNITIQNMTITQTSKGGITLQSGTDTLFMHNCFVGKSLSSNQNNIGVSLTENTNVVISQCSVLGVQASSGYHAYGVYASSCNNCTLENSTFNNSNGNTAHGIYLSSCSDFICKNNETKGNYGTSGQGYGIHLVGSSGNTITHSIISQNKSSTHAYGIKMENSSNYNKIIDSNISHQQVTGTGNTYGIHMDSSNSNHCITLSVFGNTAGTDSSSESAGIKIQSATGNVVSFCSVNFNNGNVGKGYGIFLSSVAKCVIENNKTYYNHGQNGGYGIKESGSSTSLFSANTSFGNENNYNLTILDLNAIQTVNISAPRSIQTTNLGNISITY